MTRKRIVSVPKREFSILLVDSDQSARDEIARLLHHAGILLGIDQVDTRETLVDALALEEWDAVIAGYDLGWGDALDVLDLVKARDPDCPVIMFAEPGAPEAVAVDGFKRGLRDFVPRSGPGRNGLLPALVRALAGADLARRADESRRDFRAILAAMPDLLYRFRRDGTYLQVHAPDPDRMVPESPTDLVGKRLDEVVPADLARRALDAIRTALDEGRMVSYESQVELRGQPTWFEARFVTSGPDEVLALIREITERKQAEEDLRDREQRLRILIEQMPAVLWTTDPELRFTSSTGAGLARLGLERNEVVGMGMSKFLKVVDDSEPVLDAHRRALEGAPGSAYAQVGDAAFEAHVEPLRDESGRVVGTVGVALDVTDRSRAEAALLEREAMLTQAQRIAGVGSWLWDLETDEMKVSPEFLRIFGMGSDDFDSRPEAILPRVHPDDRRRMVELIDRVRRDGRPRTVEYRVVRPDGSTRTVEAQGEVWPVAAGEGRRLLGTVQDITARKRYETLLRRHRKELQRLTAGLQEAREEERKAVAREVHDALGQGLTGLRFDLVWLRHALSADPSVETHIEGMTESVRGLIDTVRSLTRRLRPAVLDEMGLEAAVEWQVARSAGQAGLEYEVDLPEDPPKLDDRISSAIFRIVQEALTNVIRHAAARRVEVGLWVEEGGVLVLVRDDGSGISPEAVTSYESLGLMGMRERARSLGGHLEIRGKEGEGTTLTAVLPRVPAGGGDTP